MPEDLRTALHQARVEIDRAEADRPAPAATSPGDHFVQLMTQAWQFTVQPRGELTWVTTGDIPAMWLRDSSTQLRPFVLLAAHSPSTRRALEGVVRQQWRLAAADLRANAFTDRPWWSWHLLEEPVHPMVWERKYELDSLAHCIQLAWTLWRTTGSTAALDDHAHQGMAATVTMWARDRDPGGRDYRYRRPGAALSRGGKGPELGATGMTWSGFRPSDDPCTGYHVPGNLFAAQALDMVADLAAQVWGDARLAAQAAELAASLREAVAQHGLLPDQTWAYEVDGLGRQLAADDANMPSLLSLPLCGGISPDDPSYLATRARVLSTANPWFHAGSAAAGVGSPHTPGRRVWPISLAVQGLTATTSQEAWQAVDLLRATTAGTGRMHESFHADDPADFTRAWFGWADAMYCELLLALSGRRLPPGP